MSVIRLLFALVISGFAVQPAVAQSVADQARRGQPIALFDGSTLEGWAKQDGKAAKGWVIQDGTLFRKERSGDLYHSHWYVDFELTFEFKISEGGNSGVKYRVQRYGKQLLGCEFQVQDDKGRDFHRHATGAIYAVCEPSKNKETRPVGEWNQAKIVVCGDRIEHWLNGQKIVDIAAGKEEWLKRVKQSKFRDKPFFGQNREGRIFLQDHGSPVWYRNITLTPLDGGGR